MSADALLTEDGSCLRLVIDRPPANTLNMGVFEILSEAMERLETGPAELLVIRGRDKVFSKGFDLELMHSCRDRGTLRRNLVLTNAVFSRIARSTKPVVAAINGTCLGGGFELALCCHFRLCREKTRLGLPEIWNGMLPGLGGIRRLMREAGATKAVEMIALGDLIPSEEALRLNLINRVFAKETFDEDVSAFVRTLLMAPPRAMRNLLRIIRRAMGPEEDIILDELEVFRDLAPWFEEAHPEDEPSGRREC